MIADVEENMADEEIRKYTKLFNDNRNLMRKWRAKREERDGRKTDGVCWAQGVKVVTQARNEASKK